jgi:hypothetical protein
VSPLKAKAPRGGGADADTKALQPIEAYPPGPTEIDELLEVVRNFELAARKIADDPTLSVRSKCLALLELRRRARLETGLPAFAEISVWRGSKHLFSEPAVPRDLLERLRSLLRRGLSSCPTCLRDIPSHDELDRWRELEIESFRRSA